MPYQFFIIMSIIGWGIGSFLYKLASATTHPVLLATLALSLYLLLLPLMWVFIKFDHVITVSGVVFSLVGSAFMCLGTLGFTFALRSGGAAGSTTFLVALYPTLTLALSMIFLGEQLTVKKVIGIALALVSFIFLSMR
jgi:drug/metabolite transporter (DMT)-like permease